MNEEKSVSDQIREHQDQHRRGMKRLSEILPRVQERLAREIATFPPDLQVPVTFTLPVAVAEVLQRRELVRLMKASPEEQIVCISLIVALESGLRTAGQRDS